MVLSPLNTNTEAEWGKYKYTENLYKSYPAWIPRMTKVGKLMERQRM
jgi:hypothetical protein